MKNENFDAEEIYLAPETNTSERVSEKNSGIKDVLGSEDIPVMVDAEPTRAVRVREILDLRDRNRKVFQMSDGSEQAVFYSETVHVFDEETNTFEDVDNTLLEEEDGRHIVNGKNCFKARFSAEEENDELFSIESGMHRVTVSAKKNSKQRNKGVKPSIHKKKFEGVKRTDTLVFSGVQEGADYEYCVTGNGVKENIVIKEKADTYSYSFVVHQENVTAEYDEVNKHIAFISNETGKEVFFIPSPFMTDQNGAISTEVFYEVKNTANSDMILNIVADNEWINAEERAFPVVIDPQIQLSGASGMNTYSWDSGSIYSAYMHTVGTASYSDGTCSAMRMYVKFEMPALPRNPRIKKAELKFFQASSSSDCCNDPNLGLYRVTEDICTGNCTPYHTSVLLDFAKMQIGQCEGSEIVSYTFDVTTLVDQVTKGEVDVKNLVLKMIDETSGYDNSITLYGSACSDDYAPQFIVTYESSYGVNSSYRTHTHELGRFGQGSIDLQCGNLMFESEDFAWAGNRMPVTVKHLYNSALGAYQYTANSAIKLPTASFAAMKVGNGFKLNIMQSMMPVSFQHEGVSHIGYVYIGENGEELYFKKSDEQVCCDSNSQCYNLYEDVNGGDMLYDPEKRTLKQGDDTYQFDSMGRLVKITDAAGNHMDITYTADRITSVADGVGRNFRFVYNGGYLTSVTAPDDTVVEYAYTDDLLTTITYPDNKKTSITYTSNKPTTVMLLDANGNDVYRVAYTFNGDRVASVTEYGSNDSAGAATTYSYSVASGRTVVETTEPRDADEGETEDNVIKTVYTFDDEGNIVSEYVYSQDTGNTGADGEESGIHPHSGDGGVGIASNINNLLTDHNFESLSAWPSMPGNYGDLNISDYTNAIYAKFGNKALRIQSFQADCSENGVYQITNTLPAGQYTFSAYLHVTSAFSGTNAGAFIRVTDTAGNILGVSELLSKYDSEYTRLIVPFELASAQSVQVQILVNGKGTVYADAAQLENNPYANAYNMLENGNFERGTDGWEKSSGVSYSTGTRFNMSKSLMMTGSLDAIRYAYQDPAVRTTRSTRETFTLSGWAKGYGLPNHDRNGGTAPKFRLRAVVKYYDALYHEYEKEEFTADFSPCTEEWQFASVQFSKSKYRAIQYIRIYCDYDYNSGTVYFDDVQLVRNSIENNLTASDFVVESTGVSDDEVAESTDTAPVFNEAKDTFGNTITETTFTDGEFGTIYRAFGFTPDVDGAQNAGNDLVRETDARGNKVFYTVDEETSRNREVVDRLGNKTAYEYDASGKTTKVTSKDAEDTELANVSYAYDAFNNMTEILRGDGMKYALAYNQFHNLESIGVDGKTDKLIRYTYKNGNGRLKQMTYANGHTMRAFYNSAGQMVAEKWFETEAQASSSATPIAHYKYVYDGEGNIVQSIDFTCQKCYNYEYEEGRIVRATEADVAFSGEIVVSKVIVNAIKYYYDSEGQLTKKVITPASGAAQTVYYETSDDNTVVKFSAGGRAVTSHSKTDSFGRKVFDELQLGTGFVSRQFHYHVGEVTDEHKDNARLKSSATTQLVSQIILSNGTTLSYGYDAEERITSVVETCEIDGALVTNTTLYTYDALGQLLEEKVNGAVVNTMTYDNYGNIRTKNGVVYTYGDTVWKDLLTGYGNQTIAYDAQGNPTSYLGHTLTWEKGRQLKSFDSNTYTYNANGIRTSKTVGGVKHTYTLDGTKILREAWGDNALIPLYDSEDSVCGILYNDVPYYFIKNLQGDVIEIVDKDASVVAQYSYDTWGFCSIAFDLSDIGVATVNPFRYRGCYYDNEANLYYMQSRYYDSMIGRFINSDMPEYALLSMNATGHNLMAYCLNNPVNLTDSTGTVAIVDDAIVWAFIGLCAVLMLLLSWASTPQFQKSWASFCAAVGNGLSWIGTSIVNGGRAAWNWTVRQVKAATAAITAYVVIARADAKIKSKVKRESKTHYWTATLRANYVDIGRAISFGTAVSEVSKGRNVFADTRLKAKAVAKAAYSNKSPVGPEIDKGKENVIGYYYHFHVYKRKKKGHVFFLFW